MTENTEDVETADEPSGEQQTGGSSVGPAVTRRDLLRATAAAGAAATLPGTALADHGSDDPIGDISSDGTTGTNPIRQSLGSGVGGYLVGGPFAGAAAGAAGSADALFGEFEDRVDSQLQTDIYAHAETVSNENIWNLKQLDNRLADARNLWIAQGQFRSVEKLNELGIDETSTSTSTETSTSTSTSTDEQDIIDAGVTGVLEAAANLQRNALAVEEAAILRYASFAKREAAEDIALSSRITDGVEGEVLGVLPLHIDLLNGETMHTWAAHVIGKNGEEKVMHSHLTDSPIVDTGDPDLPLDSGATKLYELAHETSFNSTDSQVEYTGNLSSPISGYGFVGYVDHPDYKDTGNLTIEIFGRDAEHLNDSDYEGIDSLTPQNDQEFLSDYWTHTVYPYISVLTSEIETYASEIYSGVAAGTIDQSELTTPSVRVAATGRDWRETGDTGLSRYLLSSLGVDTDLETSMTIDVVEDRDPDRSSPATTITNPGVSKTWSHNLVNASPTIDIGFAFPGAGRDGSNNVVLPPGGSETITVTASDYTDSIDSPTWALQSIDVTLGNGDTVSTRLGSDGNGGAVGELWHEDLVSGETYTIADIDVTYTSGGSEYTETVVSGVTDLTVDTSPTSVAFRFEDAALATDWRPFDQDPDTWSTRVSDVNRYTGVSMTETSTTVDVKLSWYHDDDDSLAAETYRVPTSEPINFSAYLGDTGNVTGVTVSLANQASDVTTTVSNGLADIAHSDLLPGDGTGQYTIQDLVIEYNDGSGGTATTTVATIGATIIPADITLPEYDFTVGTWYLSSSVPSDKSLMVVDSTGEWIDVPSSGVFQIASATDVDGNQLDGVTLSDTNRRTLDTSRVEEETQRAIDLEKKGEEKYGLDFGGAAGGSGGSSSSLPLGALAIGGGSLAAVYAWARGSSAGSR